MSERKKSSRGALIFEWPDFVAEHGLGGTIANPLPPLEERYGDGDEPLVVKGGEICRKCGHWEASYERVVSLAHARTPCRCCAERAAAWDVSDADRKAGERAVARQRQRQAPSTGLTKRASKR